MSTVPATPAHAHVAYALVAGFGAQAAAQQAAVKRRLEDAVLAATARLAPADRIVLDSDEGLAVVLFGDAESALDLAQDIRERAGADSVHVGLNHGPLALLQEGREARVFGDGLSAAAAAARFAHVDRVLVTEDFARILRITSPDRARELADAGDFTDTRVRMHRFFTPDPQLGRARLRRIALYAAGGMVAILLLGVIGRGVFQQLMLARPAIIALDVRPRAEVFVDGISQGRTPPLVEVHVGGGTHRIALREAGFKPIDVTLVIKPGQRTSVTYSLQRAPEPAKPAPEKPGLWRELKRKLGGS